MESFFLVVCGLYIQLRKPILKNILNVLLPSHRRKRGKSGTTSGDVPLKDKTDVTMNSYDNPVMNGNDPRGSKGG